MCVCGEEEFTFSEVTSEVTEMRKQQKTTKKTCKIALRLMRSSVLSCGQVVWHRKPLRSSLQEPQAKERTCFPRQVHSSRQRKSLQQIVWEETNAHAVHNEEKYMRAWVASAAFPAVKRVLFYLSARQELPFLARGGLGTAVWSLEKI